MLKILIFYLKKLSDFNNLRNIVSFLFIIKEKRKLVALIILKKSQIITLKWQGKQVKFNVRDIVDFAIIFEIFVTNIYPIEKTNDPFTIFDVGAHSGFFTIYAKMLLPNATIYAFEPEPGNFCNLELNLKLNNLKNNPDVKIYNFGLSNEDQEVEFYKNVSSANCSVYKNRNYLGSIKIQLKKFSKLLDDNNLEKIDLLKMDIEGGEYEIFSDLDNQDFKKIRILFIEIHKIKDKNKDAFVDMLKNHFVKLRQDGIVYYFS